MGLAALAVGDAAVRAGSKPKKPPAKEYFDLAIKSFRGMLVEHPSNLRVRLELARALFSRGHCITPPRNLVKHFLGDDCWAAEQHFLRVVGADVPPPGRAERATLHPSVPRAQARIRQPDLGSRS